MFRFYLNANPIEPGSFKNFLNKETVISNKKRDFKMVFKVVLCVCLLQLPRYVDAWSIVTSQPIEPRLMSEDEMIDSYDVFRLNDIEMGLTAFKDKKRALCFVNDYDPEWVLTPEDEYFFVKSQPCEKVNVTTDFSTLKKKAGPKIARMCRELYIFWLTSRNMAPPPLPGAPVQQLLQPCRVKYDDDFPNQQQSSGNNHLVRSEFGSSLSQQDRAQSMMDNSAPPMIGDGAPPMIGDGAPPMIDDGAPPMIDDGAPPMMDDGAPPMIGHGAPPMIGDAAPPMIDDGAPPMIDEGAPPMSKDDDMGPPPFLQNSHGRRDLDALSLIKTPPPLNLLAVLTSRTPRAKAEEKRPRIAPISRKMVNQVKQLKTIAPPPPDMKTPPPPALFRKNM